MNGSFNTNFYLATATVIPILYIASIAQFPLIERIIASLREITLKLRKRSSRTNPMQSLNARIALVAISIVYVVTFIVAFLILLASVEAEIQSILALYHQSNYNPSGVVRAVIVLLIATLLVPTWTLLAAYARLFQGEEKPKL